MASAFSMDDMMKLFDTMTPEQKQRMETSDPFDSIRDIAKRIRAGEDYTSPVDNTECMVCSKMILDKALRCSNCKAIIYCSAACSKKHWGESQAGQPLTSHKYWCPRNKEHMLRVPYFQDQLKQFPWGRVEPDGTFDQNLARAMFDVLGKTGTGFWSQRGTPIPHANMGSLAGASPLAGLMKLLARTDHTDGKDLLAESHLNDVDGWRLDDKKLIPFRKFGAKAAKRPEIPTRIIDSWKGWYEWRRLPLESPAALLMTFPLSLYWVLVDTLRLTKPDAGSETKRVALTIHMLGVEVELNFLPLFSELALLLPYHDISLIMFGQSVKNIVDEGRKNPRSIAGKASPTSAVFTYEAPPQSGSGRVKVYLHGGDALWSPEAIMPYGHRIPDALVALNAGLGSYTEWLKPIALAIQNQVPFAATEYMEQSCEHQLQLCRTLGPRPNFKDEIKVNPFGGPGQREISKSKMPSVINGFTIVVWRREEAPEETDAVD